MDTVDTAELVRRAGDGDQDAWRELVTRYAPLVWRVARAHRLGAADAADVSQSTWIALAEHIGRLRTPERVGGWLATTARRESLRVIAARGREVVASALPEAADTAQEHRWPEPTALRGERDDTLWRAFAALPDRCRALLGLHVFAPELTYVQLAKALGLGASSVGSARSRCLGVLRRKLAILGMPGEVAG
ncbi:RNA polymerase sigma factor [Actinokineospora sp.]|uniref:RNA polymerase sigma factor n=1 Tax=Actinokineospora sp. TaxID=1872133 RepID=UPI004037B255